jgi:tRNA G18 (ribose-2'-O)-methylase SpoU
MITRCPYPECLHSFAIDYELAEGSWHWMRGNCPKCLQPASFKSLEGRDSLERAFQKRAMTTGNSGKDSAEAGAHGANCVLVEDVRSMWNVGSIFRTSDGAGIGKVYLCGVTACPPRKEISKTSLGAEQSLAWEYHCSVVSVLREMKARGYQIVGLERNTQSESIWELARLGRFTKPVCIVIGNEVTGLSSESLNLCDLVCHIPMHGTKESLNVAVAYGIAAYTIGESALAATDL